MSKAQKKSIKQAHKHYRLGYQIALQTILKMVHKSIFAQPGQHTPPPPPLSVPREKKEKQRKNPVKILKDVSNWL
jgi:hypothetical protein